MINQVTITSCWNKCPFFATSMDGMQCNHPYWDDKAAYANMIITRDNSINGKAPDECPLRVEPLVIYYTADFKE